MNKTAVQDLFFGILLVTAGIGLLLGLYMGLIRMGLSLPIAFELGAMAHGPLMINGFLATLISLERGAALEKLWSYIAPFSFFLATVLLLSGYVYAGGFFLLLGSLFLLIIMGYLCYIQSVVHHYIMAAGAISLLIGNLFFVLNTSIFMLIGWWIAFPLHIFFVGFVFSMIFAHASVIIPSLTGKLVPWSRYFYLPFFLLHGFLLLRVLGDLISQYSLRSMGSYGNVAAILLFLGGILFQLTRESVKGMSKQRNV